jgi:uncharacterized membrane protein YgdD (TMEM256/DUF423 family)
MPTARFTLTVGALLAASGVILGAFGAHVLESAIGGWALEAVEQAKRLETWETAVRYQMYHALALLVSGLVLRDTTCRKPAVAAICFLLGTTIFSGCLYGYTLTGIRILGAIVPIGGLLLICGWLLLAWNTIARNCDTAPGRP